MGLRIDVGVVGEPSFGLVSFATDDSETAYKLEPYFQQSVSIVIAFD